LKAVQNLKFRPNLVAQELGRGKTTTIGVVVPRSTSLFFDSVVDGIERGLQDTPYRSLVASSNHNQAEEQKLVDLLLARRVDGLILLWSRLPDQHLLEIAQETPLILVGRTVVGLEKQCIRVSNSAGAYQVTRHLLERGHTRIAHITGDMRQIDGIERLEGYQQALREAGIEPDPQLIVEGAFDEQTGVFAAGVLFARGSHFTALFAGNDQVAIGARLGLYRHGMRVPEDVSLVGFDDQPGSAYLVPPLTTVRQPVTVMGKLASQAALNLLEKQSLELPELTTELIIRESVATIGRNRL
jgi:LacI family transcriptional regulator